MKISEQIATPEDLELVHRDFEKFLPEDIDVTRDKNGEYVDTRVAHMWEGFTISLFRQVIVDDEMIYHHHGTNYFVIGKLESGSSSPFPPVTRKHYGLTQALVELERAAMTYPGQLFALYRPVIRRKVSRYINEPVFGTKRMWPYVPSPYYQYQGVGGGRPFNMKVFLTDDFGNAVNPPDWVTSIKDSV